MDSKLQAPDTPKTPPPIPKTAPAGPAPPSQRTLLRKQLWQEWKVAPKPMPKVKEIKECLAFFTKTERFMKRKKLIIDCAGGHGALGLAFKRLGRQKDLKVIIGDLHCPSSFANIRAAWLPRDENTTNCVEHRTIDLRDRGWLAKVLETEQIDPKDCGIVGCHVCNRLSDELIDECLMTKVEFCVLGCCHGDTSKQGRATKNSAKELGISLGTLVDTARFGVIANHDGFIAKIRVIDPTVTPENRILVGLYDDSVGSQKGGNQKEHTVEALNKVAVVYDRIFKNTQRKKKQDEVL